MKASLLALLIVGLLVAVALLYLRIAHTNYIYKVENPSSDQNPQTPETFGGFLSYCSFSYFYPTTAHFEEKNLSINKNTKLVLHFFYF